MFPTRRFALASRLVLLSALASVVAIPMHGQTTERGRFVVRQRADTLVVERFERSGARLETISVVRDRLLQSLRLELAPDGRVATLDYRAGGAERSTLRYERDTLVWLSPGAPPFRTPTLHGVMPRSILSVALLEQMVRRARILGGDSVDIPVLVAQDRIEQGHAAVIAPHPDSAVIVFPASVALGRGRTAVRLHVDGAGRLLGGGVPEQDLTIERVVDDRTDLSDLGESAAEPARPAPARRSSSAPPPVVLPGTEQRTFVSRATGRTYDLYVQVPGSAARNPRRRYPVLYVLDGQWDFKLMLAVQGGLQYDGVVPEMIVVGVGHRADGASSGSPRVADFTPVRDSSLAGSGGAPAFLAMLERELIQLVEAEYPADPARRALMGSSLGGLFTLYALFTRPAFFGAYLAASPTVVFGDGHIVSLERAFAVEHRALPVRLFISVGEVEGLAAPVTELMRAVTDRHYHGLQLQTYVASGLRHSGNKPETYNRGLQFLFAEPGW